MHGLYAFNSFAEKWMPLVTPTCLLIGVLFPGPLSHILFLVPFIFAFMTFSGSIKSSFIDIVDVFRHPLPLLVTFFLLHIAVPFCAHMIGILFFPQYPYLVTGTVLEFVVPGAVVSLMWVAIYNGSGPFTLSLVLTDTLLSPVVVPLSLRLFIGSKVHINVGQMMTELLFMIAIPAFLAMLLNQFTKGRYKKPLSRNLAPFGKIALILVVTLNSSRVAPFIRHMTPVLFESAFVILIVAISGYALGWLCALLTKQKRGFIVSMTFGAGMRNISAGAVIAGAYFPPEVMFPVMIGTIFQQLLAAFYGSALSRCYGTTDEKAS